LHIDYKDEENKLFSLAFFLRISFSDIFIEDKDRKKKKKGPSFFAINKSC
jgi:hypothetical protein